MGALVTYCYMMINYPETQWLKTAVMNLGVVWVVLLVVSPGLLRTAASAGGEAVLGGGRW